MGGAEAVYVGLNHLDSFAWIASYSGAFVMWEGVSARSIAAGSNVVTSSTNPEAFATHFPALDAKANARVKMLWIACGTADSLIGVNRAFKDWLKSKNVAFTETEIPDARHVWPLWRQNLADMAPKLFR